MQYKKIKNEGNKKLSNYKNTVLIVDNAQFTRNILKNIINKLSHVEIIGEASNGVEAVEQYKKLNPDLVILDLLIPKRGGIETIESILRVNPNALIIAVSALGQETLILEAAKKGAKDFLQKPFKREQIFEVMERMFKK